MVKKISIFLLFLFSFCLPTLHSQENLNWHAPSEILSPKRGDVIAKYIYAKYRDWEVKCKFGEDIYYHHLRVWNGFFEVAPRKTTFEDFKNAFDEILDAVKSETFNFYQSPIPIDSTFSPFNGAHRTAAVLFYQKDALCLSLTNVALPNWSIFFFSSIGLQEKYTDAMAIQYCELDPYTYVMVVFPSAVGHEEEVLSILDTHSFIVHRKKVIITEQGGMNLLAHAYENEAWAQSYAGLLGKTRACFPKNTNNIAHVFLLKATSLENIIHAKKLIRGLFSLGNHSVHCTDTHQEAILLSRALFNKNSVHFLNNRLPKEQPHFDAFFLNYRRWIEAENLNPEWFVVDTSAVLAAYGLRDCNDLDYIYFDDRNPVFSGTPGIDFHNAELKHHTAEKDELLFDPDNYFYYKGLKFCSLTKIREMKTRRGEAKDLRDISLINQILP